LSGTLRVALLGSATSPGARDLGEALLAAGQRPTLLAPGAGHAPAGMQVVRLRRLAERGLRFRGIDDGLAHVPHALVALARAEFEAAHAFSPVDAIPALAWARRSHRPVLLTFVEPLRRETIASRRLSLATLERAVGGADAVLAADDAVAASLRRLLALEAPILAPSDAPGHLALYRRLGAG